MRKATALILGMLLGSNGLWMLAAPANWYVRIPGVADSGPANLHFIRDIGAAYVVTGACLVWLAVNGTRAWPAALACGMFLALHVLVHLWDTAAGRETPHGLLRDFPAVVLPAVLTLWLAWPPHSSAKGVVK